MPIREFLNGQHFDPETMRVMGVAFEICCSALKLEGRDSVAREALAKRIIALAQQGERNPDRICERVLADLQPPPAA
jgi:hypothetical protein